MKTIVTGLWRRRLAAVAITALALVVKAHWDEPRDVPVERLLPSLEARVAKSPDDPHGQYLLGRLHSAAFANGCNIVLAFEYPEGETYAEYGDESIASIAVQRAAMRQELTRSRTPATLDSRASLEHLQKAVEHLARAAELAPDNALYELGLAFALDSGAHLSAQVDTCALLRLPPAAHKSELEHDVDATIDALGDAQSKVRESAEKRLIELGEKALPALVERRSDSSSARQESVARLLSRQWRELAIRHYWRAFTLSSPAETQRARVEDRFFDDLITVEAGRSYQRLVLQRGIASDDETKNIEQFSTALMGLERKRHSAITPVVVADSACATLDSLFDGECAQFDLAGVREEQPWPWPTREASFLVWDPACGGEITSGRQLFGSATWWMFFEDGYSALDALDENRDGWLHGGELEGLSLWRDSNRNGISEPGEVLTLAERGVTAIATHADGLDGISPMCSDGIVFRDGERRPTFDWIASPLARP